MKRFHKNEGPNAHKKMSLPAFVLVACLGNLVASSMAANLSSVSPSSGPIAGGASTTLSGTGLLACPTYTSTAIGNGHIVAISAQGPVYSWGANSSGQMGTGSAYSGYPPGVPEPESIYSQGILDNKTVKSVFAGGLLLLYLIQKGSFTVGEVIQTDASG